jgi:hypothetical protein
LAHILQDNDMVTEMYISNGDIVGSKNLLMVHKNGDLEFKWCYEDIVETQANPCLVKVGRKMMLEYGEPNLFDLRQKLPFQDEQGNLDSSWEKIM